MHRSVGVHTQTQPTAVDAERTATDEMLQKLPDKLWKLEKKR